MGRWYEVTRAAIVADRVRAILEKPPLPTWGELYMMTRAALVA